MPALTSIAVGLLVASAVVGVASVATTIIGAKTGNKTLQKIGKISGYVSMGLGVASLGVGAWASMAATTASTQAATQISTQTAEQAAAKGATEIGKSAASTAITQGVSGAAAPVATGTVTPVAAAGVQPVVTGGAAPVATTVTGTTGAAATTAPTVTAGDVAATAVTEGANISKDVMASRMVAAPPVDRTPGIMNIGSEVARAQPVAPAEGLSSYIPGWLKDLGDTAGKAATKTGEFIEKHPMASYGIIATVGSGLGGLFEADVEDKRLKQQQQQWQAIQDRQDRATYI
jgi:hypothetical protein